MKIQDLRIKFSKEFPDDKIPTKDILELRNKIERQELYDNNNRQSAKANIRT